MSPVGADFVAKVLFVQVIANSSSRGCGFRVNMWGTSSPEDKLTGDLGNVIEATSTGGLRSVFFTARKLAPGDLGLLQQYRHSNGGVLRRSKWSGIETAADDLSASSSTAAFD